MSRLAKLESRQDRIKSDIETLQRSSSSDSRKTALLESTSCSTGGGGSQEVSSIFSHVRIQKEINDDLHELLDTIASQSIQFTDRSIKQSGALAIHPSLENWYEKVLRKSANDDYARGLSRAGLTTFVDYGSTNESFNQALSSFFELRARREKYPNESFVKSQLALSLKKAQEFASGRPVSDESRFLLIREPNISANLDGSSLPAKAVVWGPNGIFTIDLVIDGAEKNILSAESIRSVGFIRSAPKDYYPDETNHVMPTKISLVKSVAGEVFLNHQSGLGYTSTGSQEVLDASTDVSLIRGTTFGQDNSGDPYSYSFIGSSSSGDLMKGRINILEQHLARKGLLIQ
jgi:hypothetical protein